MKKIMITFMLLFSLISVSSCGDPYYNDAYQDQTFYTRYYYFIDTPHKIMYCDNTKNTTIMFDYTKKWEKVYYKIDEDYTYLGYFIDKKTFKEEINQKLTYKVD